MATKSTFWPLVFSAPAVVDYGGKDLVLPSADAAGEVFDCAKPAVRELFPPAKLSEGEVHETLQEAAQADDGGSRIMCLGLAWKATTATHSRNWRAEKDQAVE